METLVSVIVPVYRAEKYIRKCLDSIRAQTYTCFEVIVIDDGSPDQCGKICDEYAKKDERFRVFHQENQGINRTREIGLQKTKGKYVFWCDSDDYVSTNWLELVVASFLKKDVDIVRFGIRNINESGEIKDEIYPFKNIDAIKKDAILGQNRSGSLWNFVARRSLWEGLHIPENISEDGYMTALLFSKAKTISVIPDVLYYRFLDNPQSITHTLSYGGYKEIALWKYRLDLCRKLYPDEIQYCAAKLLSNCVRKYCLSILYGNLSDQEKNDIVHILRNLSVQETGIHARDSFLRWCILGDYLYPCRVYARYKDRKQQRKNHSLEAQK